jgi:hypothetical protein
VGALVTQTRVYRFASKDDAARFAAEHEHVDRIILRFVAVEGSQWSNGAIIPGWRQVFAFV